MEENEKRLIEETHRKTVLCPNCLKQNAEYRENHPDTDMNEINLYCPDCGYNTA